MKSPNRARDVVSSLPGERVAMGIDVDSFAHIMGILTDLYSDPEMAVIREYSTNAYDAHVQAGNPAPIEVTLPTRLVQQLKIRDYGEGLDADDIREIYSQYGASTKRNSNDVVGMLGLGCKSALTYTDQFTLTSIKDGICTQVSVSREEDGAGSMTLVAEYETDDASGTEILIPVKVDNGFEDAAEQLFRFWPEGSVLVDGEEPKRVDGFWIADDLLMTEDVDEDTIVMGNVPYPMQENDYSYKNWHLVAFVEIGAVNFTPSRESLMFNATTKATIEKINRRFVVERDKSVEKQIAAAPTAAEAVKIMIDSTQFGYEKDPIYKGHEIPAIYKIDQSVKTNVKAMVVSGEKSYRVKDWALHWNLNATIYSEAIFFYNFDSDKFSPYKRKKIEQWLDNNNIETPKHFIMLPHIPRALKRWLDPEKVFDWKTGPHTEKIVREGGHTTQDGRPTGSYEGYVAGDIHSTLLAENIDTTKPLFYTPKNEYVDRDVVNYLHPDATVVKMGANRINKFKRDFPAALDLAEWTYEQQKKWREGLTDEQKLILKLSDTTGDKLRKFNSVEIDDPDLAEAIELAKRKATKLKAERAAYGFDAYDVEFDNPLDNYPLVGNMWYSNDREMKHIVIYINAVYSAEAEERKGQ